MTTLSGVSKNSVKNVSQVLGGLLGFAGEKMTVMCIDNGRPQTNGNGRCAAFLQLKHDLILDRIVYFGIGEPFIYAVKGHRQHGKIVDQKAIGAGGNVHRQI